MHEAEAAHVAVPVAAPAVGAGVAYEGGQGGELAEAEGVALCAAGVDEALQVAALVVEGRLGHGEGAALHDGPERVVRLREPGEHAQGPGLRKGDVEPLSGAGVTGEAQPGSEGCVAEQFRLSAVASAQVPSRLPSSAPPKACAASSSANMPSALQISRMAGQSAGMP